MPRTRVSTTVDSTILARAKRLAPGSHSRLFDSALAALIEELERERELAALSAQPYENDPELAWQAPPGPDLPYEDAIPAEVIELARQRRLRQ